jgi:hypothetical protein
MSTTIRMADGDLFVDTAGRTETVTDANKCAQDVAEVLLTPLDGLRDYGSELASLNVPQPVSLLAGRALISKKVDEAVQRLKRSQERDPYVTDQEQIEKINRLIVNNINDTDFVFWVNVLLRDATVTSTQILAVSLRHQASARFTAAIQELVRAGLP